MMADELQHARTAFRERAWGDAFARFTSADRETPLTAADLELLATAAQLLGRDDESADAWV